MKNRLLSLLISVLILVSHIHFWPVGTSLFVFARPIFYDSLWAFEFLGMILYLSVFPVPVPVVSGPGIIAVAALRLTLVLVPTSVRKPVVLLVLEGGDLILL
jgi:hypothetical protein